LTICKSLYEADVIRAVLYKYLKENIYVEENEFCWIFNLSEPSDKADVLKQKILDDILDEQLRYDLERRAGKVRELIVEHAFKPIINLKLEIDKRAI
jgi:His-Xaa-Ser system protein HxsD